MKPLEFLDRLKKSPLGRKIVADADREVRDTEQRRELVARYAALRAERDAKLPGLAAREKQVLEDAIATIHAAHREAMAIQAERIDFDQRNGGALSSIERELRLTADPSIAAAINALRPPISHLRSHLLPVGDEREIDQRIKETRGHIYPEETAALELERDKDRAARPQLQAFEDACRELGELYIENGEDQPAHVLRVISRLPVKCVCGVKHDFAPASAVEPLARGAS